MRLIPVLVLLAACQPALTRSVNSLHANGSYIEATDLLIGAIAQGDPRAGEQLDQVARDAYRMELDRAQQHEADDHLPESLAAYERLLQLEARVVAAGGPSLPDHVRTEHAKVARKTAVLHAARATVAFRDGRYQDALDGWTRADAVSPGTTEAKERIPEALTKLGDRARDAKDYREALARYQDAAQAGGGERPLMWAAAIHAAYGRYALRKGACRRAVEELTAASALPFDIRLADDLSEARACATREVVVHPFDDMVEGGIDHPTLSVLLVDQLTHHLRAHGSSYLRMLDPGSAAATSKVERVGRRVDVRGHLTRVVVDNPEPTSTEQTTTGELKVPCSPGEAPECSEQLTVGFTLDTQALRVSLAGAVKVVDRVSGEQLALTPLDMRLDKTRNHATVTKVTDSRGFTIQAPVGPKATERTVGVRGDAAGWFNDSPPLPDPVRVLDEAVVRLAASAADAVLAAVDREPELPEPESLTLLTPVTSAEEITFGDAPMDHDPDEPSVDTPTEVDPGGPQEMNGSSPEGFPPE